MRKDVKKRSLQFATLRQVIKEARRLESSGYVRVGNWSLAQACHHLRLTVDASIDGYPRWMSIALPFRPLLRWLILPRLMRGDSPSGISTAGIFIPPDPLDDANEILKFEESVKRFIGYNGSFYAHPGFGSFDRANLELFHAMHAAHHFGFLLPANKQA